VAIKEPFPELEEILGSIGEGGQRIATIDAAEGAAGNISVCIGWPIEIRRRFPVAEEILLPVAAPHLIGQHVVVTGSGRRLRDIAADPVANLGVVGSATTA
jgi:rhamnulose-1-phosphate aldolase